MSAQNRREWGKMMLGGVAAGLALASTNRARAAASASAVGSASKIDSKVKGVQLGAQSYSFRDRPLDGLVQGMVDAGLGSCELWQGHTEPQKVSREEMKKWRLTTPLSFFKDVRGKFDRAGVEIYAYNYSFRDDFTDEEIEQGFKMAQALGVGALTASATVSVAKRVDVAAMKYKMPVGFHNHDQTEKPNEFSTPETFAKALEGASPYLRLNLDIGHFVAANQDPVAYLKEHHDKIVTIHVKDRKRDHGANMPFGQGDTPVVAVLQLIRDNKWTFPANIEYEYKGADTVAEVKKCYDFCRQALMA